MKMWYIYIAFFLFSITGFLIMIGASTNPEKVILGEWNEVEWKYEKVDKPQQFQSLVGPSENVKEVVGNNRLIHTAEKWCFYPDGTLHLISANSEKIVKWRIKGRGHILQLKHKDKCIENYNIDVLNNQSLVLNFEADIEVRGIAKLAFNKIRK